MGATVGDFLHNDTHDDNDDDVVVDDVDVDSVDVDAVDVYHGAVVDEC